MTTETLSDKDIAKMISQNMNPNPPAPPPEKPKLTQLMELVGSVSKDKQNDFHHYRYASAKAVLDKVQAGLVELGMYSVPTFAIEHREGDLITVSVDLGVWDGSEVVAITTAFGSGSDKGDKGVMKAQTAALKYAWMTLLNIPTGDDPEADTTTDARTAPNVSQPASLGVTGALGHVTNAKVLEVKKKNADNPKSPYTIVTDKGTYDTFDKDIIAQMSLAQASGLITDFAFKETKWGKDIVKEKPNGTAPVTER